MKYRCDYCGGHLGLIVDRYYRMRFCCKAHVSALINSGSRWRPAPRFGISNFSHPHNPLCIQRPLRYEGGRIADYGGLPAGPKITDRTFGQLTRASVI